MRFYKGIWILDQVHLACRTQDVTCWNQLVWEGYRLSRKCTLHISGITITDCCAPPLSHQTLQNRRLIFRTAQFHYMAKIVNWFPDLGKPSIKTIEFSERKNIKWWPPILPLPCFWGKNMKLMGRGRGEAPTEGEEKRVRALGQYLISVA